MNRFQNLKSSWEFHHQRSTSRRSTKGSKEFDIALQSYMNRFQNLKSSWEFCYQRSTNRRPTKGSKDDGDCALSNIPPFYTSQQHKHQGTNEHSHPCKTVSTFMKSTSHEIMSLSLATTSTQDCNMRLQFTVRCDLDSALHLIHVAGAWHTKSQPVEVVIWAHLKPEHTTCKHWI